MTITMTAWKRPEYTRQVIRALEACEGSDNVSLYAHIEPGNEEVQAIIIGSRLTKDVTVNPSVLGIPRNTFNALQHGFTHDDYVIHMEDDTLPAVDFLNFHKWARGAYRDDKDVFSITGYNNLNEAVTGQEIALESKIGKRQWFTCWGWGTWADRWAEIAEYWSNDNPGFAWHVNLGIRLNRVEVFPLLSRVQNIGDEDGVHRKGGDNSDKVDMWAGDTDFVIRRFHER